MPVAEAQPLYDDNATTYVQCCGQRHVSHNEAYSYIQCKQLLRISLKKLRQECRAV